MNESTAVETQAVETQAQPKSRKPKTRAAKPSANGAKLGKAHIRILKALKQAGKPITRTRINEICAKTYDTAKKFSAWLTEPLGQTDSKARKIWEKKSGKPSLLTLGLVRMDQNDIDGIVETIFQITAAGKKALANHG